MKNFLLSFFLTLALGLLAYEWRSGHFESSSLPDSTTQADAADKKAASPPAIIPHSLPADLLQSVKQIAAGMSRLVPDPSAEEKNAAALASKLTSEEANALKDLALNERAPGPERFTAVYLLKKRPDFFVQIAEIGTSAYSAHARSREFENTLRIEALQAMETQAPDPEALSAAFARARKVSASPFLRRLAAIGEEGVRRGRPAIKTFLDSKLGASHAR
ncbi:MAG: hypothetical protein ACXWQO_17985 [Bdellovibrionota bacterium]